MSTPEHAAIRREANSRRWQNAGALAAVLALGVILIGTAMWFFGPLR